MQPERRETSGSAGTAVSAAVVELDQQIGWTGRVAEALGLGALDAGQVEAVLALAGEVAHGTGQRSFAPLTAFLAGLYTAQHEADREALEEVRGVVAGLLGQKMAGGGPINSDGARSERGHGDG
ncbi:MAG: DUF6457 domain-containing protein [Acidimicrobiales bacterium]